MVQKQKEDDMPSAGLLGEVAQWRDEGPAMVTWSTVLFM